MRVTGIALIAMLATLLVACSGSSEDTSEELTAEDVGTLWVAELESRPPGPLGVAIGAQNLFQEYRIRGLCPNGPRIGEPANSPDIWVIECDDQTWNMDKSTSEFVHRDEFAQ